MKNSIILDFLYHTAAGRSVLKLLVQPGFSKTAAYYLSSPASKWLIGCYIKKYNINMTDIDIPDDGFRSFNDFFTRKKKYFCMYSKEKNFISPCEGYLSVSEIKKETVFDIKNSQYSLSDLLKDNSLSKKFENGTALVFRLTPANYHRYCYAADGRVIEYKKIDGVLHCVRPVALRQLPVFTQNYREYQVIQTKDFGTIVQMEIGALMVGKIHNYEHCWRSHGVHAGMEKGYFEFGGSTIILLLQKDAVRMNRYLSELKITGREKAVSIGQNIVKKSS